MHIFSFMLRWMLSITGFGVASLVEMSWWFWFITAWLKPLPCPFSLRASAAPGFLSEGLSLLSSEEAPVPCSSLAAQHTSTPAGSSLCSLSQPYTSEALSSLWVCSPQLCPHPEQPPSHLCSFIQHFPSRKLCLTLPRFVTGLCADQGQVLCSLFTAVLG